jgi:hypothetical protein
VNWWNLKTVIFYIDPATPKWIYLIQGVNDWQVHLKKLDLKMPFRKNGANKRKTVWSLEDAFQL